MQNGTRSILFRITNKGGRILEQQFDKQKMSQLVKQAMGEKTPFEYCRLSKLNSEYIDRLMTMQVKKPPSIGIMQQIAASSQGLVTLKELKMAAGYEQDETEIHPETGERTQPPKKQRKYSELKLTVVSRHCRKRQKMRRNDSNIWNVSVMRIRKT